MNLGTTNLRKIAGVALAASIACAPALALADTAPAFTAAQTTANYAPANTQTLSTSTVTANTPQVKATRTLTVSGVPTAAVGSTTTSVIGSCTVTYSTTTPDSLGCGGNAAVVNTVTHATTASVALALGSLTSLTDAVNGHGALTATSSGSTSTFTTTGTEASSSPIRFIDNTGGSVTSSSSTAGTVPVAQVMSATPANVEIGDWFTVLINGTNFTGYTASAATVSNVTTGLAAAINSATSSISAVSTGTQVNITASVAGTPFTILASTTNASAHAQVVTFTPTDPGHNDVFTLTINGTSYSATIGLYDTTQSLVENLAAQVAANVAVSCTENDVSLTCTSATPGTAFTYSASVDDQDGGSNSSHHGGGGGGSSHSSSSSTSTSSSGSVSTPAVTTTTTTTTSTGAASSASVSAWPVMTKGATGASVIALQTWLIAKGYSIPAGATGYFGAQTTAALAAYQKASGISPAVGYFGPITRAYIASH